jgi:hypothetical protein
MEFIVRQLTNQPDTVLVRYNCACGCKPGVRYRRGSQEAGHEHCCCGNVHFVGPQARQRMETYLADRRVTGEDAGLVYALHDQQLATPWGESVAVAYALPDKPKKH